MIYETNILTDRTTYGCQGTGGVGREWTRSLGFSRCKLLYREWIKNKVLLYSIVNSIQHLMINHNEKEYEKDCIYMYN